MFKIRRCRGSLLILVLMMALGCEKKLDIKDEATDSVAIFDELWSVMDQRYSMFSFKEVDWDRVYTEYRQQVTTETDPLQLFRICSRMLETLKDGHVALLSEKDTAGYLGFYTTYAANFSYRNIVDNYLRNDYKTKGPVIYKIVDGVGYLYYRSFFDTFTETEVNALFGELVQTKGLIVDVRDNTGGNSANVITLFSHFLAERKLVKYNVYKSSAGRNDFSSPDPFYIEPSNLIYSKPVVLLTNRKCYSACNDFVLYMSDLSNVKIMGDQTGGGGGVPYNYILSNGWKLQYSATATLSPERINIENGIQPDINIGITTIEENTGKDPILEKAFEALQ
ncbi:MAG: S41 family peptidase [Chitinophagaceae bacterium]|nr:S41 family peptidase [Chitinophagaceae bacterium]